MPAVVPSTFTETVQVVPAANVALDKDTDVDCAVAVTVPPVQLLFTLLGVATTRPAGKLSVKETPFSVVFVSGFLTVNVKLVVPFSTMVGAPKDLLIEGGSITVTLALDVFPFPASEELIVTLFK